MEESKVVYKCRENDVKKTRDMIRAIRYVNKR